MLGGVKHFFTEIISSREFRCTREILEYFMPPLIGQLEANAISATKEAKRESDKLKDVEEKGKQLLRIKAEAEAAIQRLLNELCVQGNETERKSYQRFW